MPLLRKRSQRPSRGRALTHDQLHPLSKRKRRLLYDLAANGVCFPESFHQSRKLARCLLQQDGWKLQIVKRQQRAFKITGLTWIVERSFAWLGRNRRLSKDYEYNVQTSETLIDIAATRLILNRLASA